MSDISVSEDNLNQLNSNIIQLLTWASEQGIPTAIVFSMIDNIKFEHQYSSLQAAYQAQQAALRDQANAPKIVTAQ